ncbi:hypothetical protein LMG33818_001923 [Halomonadaceae bacterium LMG 33818]|uniref:GNAT family N-acetyltransferase n=1 Tax=Cernens ardua TaxID=3402176 RepID=UPI003EDC8565
MVSIRPATPADIPAMTQVLTDIYNAGKRSAPGDEALVRSRYIERDHGITCLVAVDDMNGVIGFQSLIRATHGNIYGAPEGWGVIGTHISPLVARQGVGRKLFQHTRAAAREAGLIYIEAMIALESIEAQAYYESMGFRTYKVEKSAVGKCLTLSDVNSTTKS